jgi:hypothetical protein
LEDENLLSAAILGERVVFGEMKIASQKQKYLKTARLELIVYTNAIISGFHIQFQQPRYFIY